MSNLVAAGALCDTSSRTFAITDLSVLILTPCHKFTVGLEKQGMKAPAQNATIPSLPEVPVREFAMPPSVLES